MKQITKRLTYANVMSSIAVFLVVAGGSAVAATQLGKNSVGTNQLTKNAVTTAKIKNDAVTGAKVKNGSLTGADIDLSTLGSVPSAINAGHANSATNADHATSANSATNADHATSADSATNATNATNAAHATSADSVADVHVFKAGAVTAAASYESAPKVELGSVGPFNFYGKCYAEAGRVHENTYIEVTSGTATLGSEGGANFDSNEFLTPTTEEESRVMKGTNASNNEWTAQSGDEEFQANASDGTEITGEIGGVGAKMGTTPEGNGPFLAGDSCIVGAIAVFGG